MRSQTTRPSWLDNPDHHRWLASQTDELFAFYERGVADQEQGGFHWLDDTGRPMPGKGKPLWLAARMVHCFSIGVLLGRPGCAPLVEHGLAHLTDGPLRDRRHGGWRWHVGADGDPVDGSKQAYGQAFVLLAACSAAQAGFDTEPLRAEVLAVLEERFWSGTEQMYVDAWDETFAALDPYRGQNANMHLAEALMATAEVTGDSEHLPRVEAIATRLIREATAGNGGRLPEHFDADWWPDLDYNRDRPDDPFRPYGSTVGHWLEWSRLLLQMVAVSSAGTTGGEPSWATEAAVRLFERAVAEAWDDERGGFAFTVDWDGRVLDTDRYHWVIAEAIGAACYLYRATEDPAYAAWYERCWDFAASTTIDEVHGGWCHQLDSHHRPSDTVWQGKPDLYHALQATLYARVPLGTGICAALAAG